VKAQHNMSQATYVLSLLLVAASAYGRKEFHPEESDLFEGDIAGVNPQNRNAVLNKNALWPGGKIPYVIGNEYSASERAMILQAIEQYRQKTCIRFVQRKGESDYVSIYRGQNCYSNIGRQGGNQRLSLGSNCFTVGLIIHELMHAVGFWHEQSRADRDDYITIKWDNIDPAMKQNFNKLSLSQITHLNTQYDCGSVLHYGPYLFSKNGQRTIVGKTPQCDRQIRDPVGFSSNDIAKINRLYNCRRRNQPAAAAVATTPERPGRHTRYTR